jgi:hypothetical protein
MPNTRRFLSAQTSDTPPNTSLAFLRGLRMLPWPRQHWYIASIVIDLHIMPATKVKSVAIPQVGPPGWHEYNYLQTIRAYTISKINFISGKVSILRRSWYDPFPSCFWRRARIRPWDLQAMFLTPYSSTESLQSETWVSQDNKVGEETGNPTLISRFGRFADAFRIALVGTQPSVW